MKVIGKDGTPVDRVEGDRIKLTKKDSGAGHQGHHHYIDRKLVGAVEGDTVKLAVNADAVPDTGESSQKSREDLNKRGCDGRYLVGHRGIRPGGNRAVRHAVPAGQTRRQKPGRY